MLSPKFRKALVFTGFCASILVLHSLYFCSPYVCSQKRYFVSDLTSNHLDDPDYCAHVHGAGGAEKRPEARAFVVAALKDEDTSWLDRFEPEWEKYPYLMDDPEAKFKVPANKGHEAMAYLTYIIDHWKRLPQHMVFLHGSQYQWHNEDPMYDGVEMLKRLQLDHVSKEGYANLRCTWELGCPATIRPFHRITQVEAALQPNNDRANTEAAYAQAFRELFPEQLHREGSIPTEIGVPCGGQFAVTAKQVRQRPLCEYERYRDWLLATKLPDSISGRVFEYSWHIIFGKPAVTCPTAETCFCEKFGLCNLTCSEGSCQGRYWPPPKWQIPDQWPQVGLGTAGLPYDGWSEQ